MFRILNIYMYLVLCVSFYPQRNSITGKFVFNNYSIIECQMLTNVFHSFCGREKRESLVFSRTLTKCTC